MSKLISFKDFTAACNTKEQVNEQLAPLSQLFQDYSLEPIEKDKFLLTVLTKSDNTHTLTVTTDQLLSPDFINYVSKLAVHS